MKPLAGKHIVITRPAHQSAQIKQWLEGYGANITLLPVIEIQAIHTVDISSVKNADWLVFISPNAVEYGLKQLETLVNLDLSNKTIAAIGKKTAKVLEQHQIKANIVPENGFNTESFLELPATQAVENKRIVIFRGEGGRELLAKTLRQRKANVEYAEVYRRVCPQYDMDKLKSQWKQQLLDIIVITSSEGLYNLYTMVKQDWIKHVPLLLSSERMKTAATELGHQGKIIMATNPSDESVLSRLLSREK